MITTKLLYANAAIGQQSEILQDIHVKTKNIAVHQRDITALQKELDLIAEQDVECRAKGTVAEIMAELQAYFEVHLPQCTTLLEDIVTLLKRFEQTTEAAAFRLLLASVSTNMCSRFHTDINDIRMLCTYIGPGTLWVPDEIVDHKALQKGRDNQAIIKDEEQIQQLNTGDVVLLKGALYPDANPILHRSPPIEQAGIKRLLLKVDTNEFLSFLNQV